MKLDKVYEEKVYAGVLGKLIGVYLGRPFEQWTHERILEELGQINYYVNEKLNVPLVVTDDDITGTFTFLRALRENNFDPNITAKQIGQSWLNNLIENKTVLWWGGRGHSAEDTAFQNLKDGIHAPMSGSIETNGEVIAQQIGAQIFIDGWALVTPGDPEKAVELAKKAASVSHDGEAIYGAQMVAAMESLAFIEKDINKIINESKKYIPNTSEIYKVIGELQNIRSGNSDWMQARQFLAENYDYDKYLGECHMIPNHAIIILSLLFGDDNLQKTLMIVNTAGRDTDCNSGNVGCLMGIKNGLEGLNKGPDYLSPIQDRMYCPTANGGETQTDALTEAYKVINTAKRMNNENIVQPKNGSRFHFEMPGSVQGWRANYKENKNISTHVQNIKFDSKIGNRGLEIKFDRVAPGVISEALVDIFFPQELHELTGRARERFFQSYNFISCPLLYSGQTIESEISFISNSDKPINVKCFINIFGKDDEYERMNSEEIIIYPGKSHNLKWKIPSTEGNPITQVGFSIESEETNSGSLIINHLDFTGEPNCSFYKPKHIGDHKRGVVKSKAIMWKSSWVNAVDKWEVGARTFRITKDSGRGIIITGNEAWKNYTVSAEIAVQRLTTGGLAVRVQGLNRYYGLVINSSNKLQLIKVINDVEILKEMDFNLEYFKNYNLSLKIVNNNLSAYLENELVLEYEDKKNVLESGAIGLVIEDGTLVTDEIMVK